MPRQVRVSHERFIPFAEWLVARLGPPFLAPRDYGGTGWVASVDLFVRSVRGTLGEGKPRPAMELMILGPEDPKYDDPVTPVRVLHGLRQRCCAVLGMRCSGCCTGGGKGG